MLVQFRVRLGDGEGGHAPTRLINSQPPTPPCWTPTSAANTPPWPTLLTRVNCLNPPPKSGQSSLQTSTRSCRSSTARWSIPTPRRPSLSLAPPGRPMEQEGMSSQSVRRRRKSSGGWRLQEETTRLGSVRGDQAEAEPTLRLAYQRWGPNPGADPDLSVSQMWKVTPRPHVVKQPVAGSSRLPSTGHGPTARLPPIDGGAKVEYLATLKKHTAVVNVVRWSPDGK